MSSSLDVTVTLSAVAVPELAEGEGGGEGVEADDVDLVVVEVEAAGVETASCAMTILVINRIAPNEVANFFMKVVCRSSSQACDWLWRSRFRRTPGEAAHLHKCEPRFRRSGLTITLREKTRLDLRYVSTGGACSKIRARRNGDSTHFGARAGIAQN